MNVELAGWRGSLAVSGRAPWARGDYVLTGAFVAFSLLAVVGRLGADTTIDEAVYCGISRSIWEHGRAGTIDGTFGGTLFKDNPVLVPLALSPVMGLTNSVQATRLAHWLLFVLPGLLVTAACLRRAGRFGMTVGMAILLLNPFQLSYVATHVNLDAGLSSWGLIAIYCFVSGQLLWLGLVAILIATACKYQAVVVCLVLLLCTVLKIQPWKRLLLYGCVSGATMLLWLALITANEPGFLGYGFGRFVWQSKALASPWHRLFGLYPALLLPAGALAVVGLVRNRHDNLVRACGLYLAVTVVFNLLAIRLPGGMNYYLATTFLPLAVCAGLAVPARPIGLWASVAVLAAASVKGFVDVPVPFAGYSAVLLAFAGATIYAGGRRWGAVFLLAAPVVVVLPRAQELQLTRTPDGAVRTLLSRCDERGWTPGTWEDARVPLWGDRPLVQAKYADGWAGVDYFIHYNEKVRQFDPNYPDRWKEFHAYLAADYELDEETGQYAGYVRRGLKGASR